MPVQCFIPFVSQCNLLFSLFPSVALPSLCFVFCIFRLDCRCAVKQSKAKHHHHHNTIRYNGPFVAKYMYYYLYHPCMCTTSTSVHVCHAMAHTNKRAIAERKFCMMRIQSHFDMHSIFICENFVYTQIDYIYLYVDIFVRIFSDRFHLLLLSVSVSLSPSHSLPFRVRATVRPSFVYNFQFNLNCVCALCMNRKFSIIIVMISSFFFHPSVCIVIESCECICVYVWHVMAWLQYSVFPHPAS